VTVVLLCCAVRQSHPTYVPCMDCTGQANDFELTLMVEMETRHPIDESFFSELPSLCNHCRIMAA